MALTNKILRIRTLHTSGKRDMSQSRDIVYCRVGGLDDSHAMLGSAEAHAASVVGSTSPLNSYLPLQQAHARARGDTQAVVRLDYYLGPTDAKTADPFRNPKTSASFIAVDRWREFQAGFLTKHALNQAVMVHRVNCVTKDNPIERVDAKIGLVNGGTVMMGTRELGTAQLRFDGLNVEPMITGAGTAHAVQYVFSERDDGWFEYSPWNMAEVKKLFIGTADLSNAQFPTS